LREQAIGEQPLQEDEEESPAAVAATARAPAAVAEVMPPAREPAQAPATASKAPAAAVAVEAVGQASPPVPAPVVAAPLPTEELTSVVASAGLEWVQTTHAPDPTVEETMPLAPRPRRQRKPKPQIIAEPLQQVETQPDDRAS
jgi:ribonuclease E